MMVGQTFDFYDGDRGLGFHSHHVSIIPHENGGMDRMKGITCVPWQRITLQNSSDIAICVLCAHDLAPN